MNALRWALDKVWDAAYWLTRTCRLCEQTGWHAYGCPNKTREGAE